MIAKFMQELRQRGFTQDMIALMTGITQANVSRLFRGSEPNATTLIKLADAFDVSIDEILGREPRKVKAA